MPGSRRVRKRMPTCQPVPSKTPTNRPMATHPLTQTAPDEESEAADQTPGIPNLQVIRGEAVSPLSGSNRRPPLYKSGALAS
jgi:hypothetical protein